nr:hypothetical protein [uncultured bacterium]
MMGDFVVITPHFWVKSSFIRLEGGPSVLRGNKGDGCTINPLWEPVFA